MGRRWLTFYRPGNCWLSQKQRLLLLVVFLTRPSVCRTHFYCTHHAVALNNTLASPVSAAQQPTFVWNDGVGPLPRLAGSGTHRRPVPCGGHVLRERVRQLRTLASGGVECRPNMFPWKRGLPYTHNRKQASDGLPGISCIRIRRCRPCHVRTCRAQEEAGLEPKYFNRSSF